MLAVNTRVEHNGHGPGIVIRHNTLPRGNPNSRYPDCTFYDGERYPNVVLFDSGFEEVYADTDLVVIEGE